MKAQYRNTDKTAVALETSEGVFAVSPDDPRLVGLEIAPYEPPPPPPAPVPRSVSRFQMREALLETTSPDPRFSSALELVDTIMSARADRASRAWLEATVYERASPTVAELARQFGWTDTQVDDLFRRAEGIRA